MQIRKGDLFYADLTPVIGSEQGGVRPVLIIQNDTGNRHSPTVIAAAVTSRSNKNPLPTHVGIGGTECGLRRSSTVLLEQVRTIDRSRLREYIGHLDGNTMCAGKNPNVWISAVIQTKIKSKPFPEKIDFKSFLL